MRTTLEPFTLKRKLPTRELTQILSTNQGNAVTSLLCEILLKWLHRQWRSCAVRFLILFMSLVSVSQYKLGEDNVLHNSVGRGETLVCAIDVPLLV